MKQKIISLSKSIGPTLSGVFIVLGILILVPLLYGLIFVGTINLYINHLKGYLDMIDGFVELLIIIFLFLCIFRKCRIWAGTALIYCSYALALSVWLDSLVYTYGAFGLTGVFTGILFAGIGIYITGLAALLKIHAVSSFWLVALSLVVIFGIRFLGAYIVTKEEQKRSDLELDDPVEDYE